MTSISFDYRSFGNLDYEFSLKRVKIFSISIKVILYENIVKTKEADQELPTYPTHKHICFVKVSSKHLGRVTSRRLYLDTHLEHV